MLTRYKDRPSCSCSFMTVTLEQRGICKSSTVLTTICSAWYDTVLFFFHCPHFLFLSFFIQKKKKKSSSLLDPVMMESCCCHTGCFAWANKKWRVKKRGHCGVEEKKIQHLPDVFLSPYSLKTAHRTFELQLHFRKINFDLYTQNNAVKYNMKHYLTFSFNSTHLFMMLNTGITV